MKRLITADEVIAMRPCSEYDSDRIKRNHGEGGITVDEIWDLDIPCSDRFWVLIRLVPKDKRRLVVADIAETVLHVFEDKFPNDDRPRKVIEAYRKGAYADATAAAYAAYADATADAYADATADKGRQWIINFEIVKKYIEEV